MSTTDSPSQRENTSTGGYKEQLDEVAMKVKNPQSNGSSSNEGGVIAQTVEKGITIRTEADAPT